MALSYLRPGVLDNLPSFVRDLKMQRIQIQLDDIEEEMKVKGKNYVPNNLARQLVYTFSRYLPQGVMKSQALRLQEDVHQIIVHDLSTKYTLTTPLKHIAKWENSVLWRMHPKGEHDPSFHPVVLKLYWEDKLDWLEREVRKFAADPQAFLLSEEKDLRKHLKSFVRGDVPAALKRTALQFLADLHSAG